MHKFCKYKVLKDICVQKTDFFFVYPLIFNKTILQDSLLVKFLPLKLKKFNKSFLRPYFSYINVSFNFNILPNYFFLGKLDLFDKNFLKKKNYFLNTNVYFFSKSKFFLDIKRYSFILSNFNNYFKYTPTNVIYCILFLKRFL